MTQLTKKDLSLKINIGEIEESARAKWDKQQTRRRNISQWLVRLLPPALIVMLLVFYMLSAPHTAELLDRITPGMGRVAPIGFELGVLIVAALREAGWKNAEWRKDITRWILYCLLGISICINVAGGFIAVIASSLPEGVMTSNIETLLGQFPVLPAVSQIVLILVLPLGVIISIMVKFAGEAVVKFSLNKITLTAQTDADLWLKDRRKALQQGLYEAAIKLGAGAVTAGDWSQQMVTHWYRETRDSAPQPAPQPDALGQPLPDTAPAHIPTPARAEMGFAGLVDKRTDGLTGLNGIHAQHDLPVASHIVPNVHSNGQTDGRTKGRVRNASEIVRAHLRENPADVNTDVRKLGERLGVSKTVVSNVQKEFRS